MHDSAPVPVTGRQAYALILLLLIQVCRAADQLVLVVLLEPIKAEFGLGDGKAGLLMGLAFSIPVAVAGLGFASFIDRINRRNFLIMILLAWTLLTAACGFAPSYEMLLLLRIGIGIAEASGSPLVLSLIADIIPERRRATAIGILYLATPLGYMVSLMGGGLIAGALGWRAVFPLIAAPGLMLALLALATLREPRRGTFADAPTADGRGIGGALRFLGGHPNLVALLLAILLLAISSSAITSWSISFLIRHHGLALGSAGAAGGLVIGLIGGVSSVASGWLTDRLSTGDRRWAYRLPMIGAAVGLVTGLALLNLPMLGFAIAMLGLFAIAAIIYVAPAYSIMLGAAPPNLRGAVMSITVVALTLMGGLGPSLAGLLSQYIGGTEALRIALSLIVLVNIPALLLLRRAAKPAGPRG